MFSALTNFNTTHNILQYYPFNYLKRDLVQFMALYYIYIYNIYTQPEDEDGF